MINEVAEWLGATSLNAAIQNNYWVIPIIQSVHILCISIVFASMAMLDLRLLGIAGTRQSVGVFGRRFLPWTWWALLVLLISGSLLITGEPARELQSFFFWLKMGLLAAVVVITLLFQLVLNSNGTFWERNRPAAALVGLVSLALWLGIVACGRWIAYGAHG